MSRTKFVFLFLFIPLICAATDLKPWFGNDYEVEIRATLLYQNYHAIAIAQRSFRRNANDKFVTLSGAYPFKRYCGEFEATAAFTGHQNHRWDCFRVTGRYLWMDELDGNAFNLATGITLTEPYSRALHDVSSFHHGHIEGEAHFSIGKKFGYPTCIKDYLFRFWHVFGIGVAEEGSPWLRGNWDFEYNYGGLHHFRGFVNTLWGIGGRDLRIRCFKGYGNVKHKSVDVGIRYGYVMGCWGTLSLQFARRVYAYNFPKDANLFLCEYYFPFGSQISTNY